MIYPLTLQEWKSFDARHPAPTFFARPAWSLAIAHAYPHLRPYPVRVRDIDGDVLIPLMQVSSGRLSWRAFVGMPMGSYTCALMDDGSIASPAAFGRAICAIGRSSDSIKLTPWPLSPLQPLPNWEVVRHDTAVVDLGAGTETPLRTLSGVSRRMAGQAERRGVECLRCESPAVGITTYYAILREASEGWGTGHPPFAKELLEALVAFGGEDVEIWLAHCDGHPIAGGVVLYGSQELFFWSAAMRRAFARLRPSNALNVALMQAAIGRQLRWYNLGASEGLPGVERFKRGLGARVLPYLELRHDGVAFNWYSRIRSSVSAVRRGKAPRKELAHGRNASH